MLKDVQYVTTYPTYVGHLWMVLNRLEEQYTAIPELDAVQRGNAHVEKHAEEHGHGH